VDTKEGVSGTSEENSGSGSTGEAPNRENRPTASGEFKAMVRPLLSLLFGISLMGAMFGQYTPPAWYLGIAITYLGGWGVSRQFEKRNGGK